jgi:hypothetical protein
VSFFGFIGFIILLTFTLAPLAQVFFSVWALRFCWETCALLLVLTIPLMFCTSGELILFFPTNVSKVLISSIYLRCCVLVSLLPLPSTILYLWQLGLNPSIDELPLQDRPAALTKAALEPAIGVPLYPGIESQLDVPFTIRDDALPGDLTKYLSLPWQSDFYECQSYW